MRRLAHRLRPRWPRWLVLGGAGSITAFWLGMCVYATYDPSLKLHQRQMVLLVCGGFGLFCTVAFARLLAASGGETVVEVDPSPAAPGQELRVFVLQRGGRPVKARLLCFRRKGRVEAPAVELPLGSAEPAGLRAQFEAAVQLPADAEPTRYDQIRWCVEVRSGRRVEQFPLLVR